MTSSIIVQVLAIVAILQAAALAEDGPVAAWSLAGNTRNTNATGPHGENHGVTFQPGEFSPPWAKFDGRESFINIPAAESLRLGTGDFTICARVYTGGELADDLGDIVSQFDSKTRTGFHLSLRNNAGVTHSQANYRQLQFGIDAGSDPVFIDEGRPGNAIFGQSMAAHDGALYVGTCEPGADQAGHVYRYDGTNQWTDLGSPDRANSITSMAAWNNSLYVGSGKYRLGGSALAESENPNLGGRIYRLLSKTQHPDQAPWEEVGHFPEMEATGGMVVFRGKLYVSSLYKPAAFFRYEGGRQWTRLPLPDGKRVEALGVFNGFLWATGYDEGHVYRFDGDEWTDLGRVGEEENTQTYAFAGYLGRLHVATWRTGKVFARQNDAWHDRGRLGEELEVMGMLVHNGSLYAGSLPLAQVYRYEGGQSWRLLKQLDTTPEVKYRRVWTMAQYQGKLFMTTLPSGHVWSMRTGACVTWDHEFPAGWHHVAARRHGDSLQLLVDGRPVAESSVAGTETLALDSDAPWRIGAGPGDFFNGSLSDVRVYRRALTADEIHKVAKRK